MSRSLSAKELRWIASDWRLGKPRLLHALRQRNIPDPDFLIPNLERVHAERVTIAFLAGLSARSILSNFLADPEISEELFRNRLKLALERARYTKQHKIARRMAGAHTLSRDGVK